MAIPCQIHNTEQLSAPAVDIFSMLGSNVGDAFILNLEKAVERDF